jgi:superfamily II DNA or RNA helicase/HKD family nuclease
VRQNREVVGDGADDLQPGLYDTILDQALTDQVSRLESRRLRAQLAEVEPAELPDRTAEIIADWARRAVAAASTADRHDTAMALASGVLDLLVEQHGMGGDEGSRLAPTLQRLLAVEALAPTGEPMAISRPLTPLRDTVLMTNARDQPTVGREIVAEIESADRIDLVLAFIRWTGVRDLLPALRRHVEAGRPLRVITTTYTGSTELRALLALAEVGAQVKVSYDTASTRLHAKAWCFHRATGFSTVYIGSSNLTFSAQVTGREWNVRASERRNPDLIDTFDRVFETYWADPHFEPFDAADFSEATARLSDDSIATPFTIEPYPFQRQILEQLEVERRRGRNHNLVVAATGTGKTVVAALDYRQLRTRLDRSRLLFVAHRREILENSRTTFRHVLQNGSFGELWVGGEKPQRWEHVFASIQSMSAGDLKALDPDQFDIVIVDEFHHAAATTYSTLLDHLHPAQLLGLTATPERTDSLDILRWFEGRMAVELRLWDALEQDLLSPFHYYGIHDGTDLASVTWRRGRGYDPAELTNVYTGDDLWVGKVLAAVREKVGDPRSMRALGFGVSVAHCEFLADRFTRAGITARVVSANTSTAERDDALVALAEGRVQVLFSVDLFNEGIDVPAIDVVLMLRPTDSATVFLQQLGRGLRRSPDKDVLTVLDFVGHQATSFRFDLRYRRMLGRTRREIERDVDEDFPYLPAGCQVKLDPVAKKIVLDNIRTALPVRWPDRVRELRELGDVSLPTYLNETGLEREDVYRGGRSFTEIRRAAGVLTTAALAGEERLGRGLGRILHVDDLDRIETYVTLLGEKDPIAEVRLDERRVRQLQGLLLTLFGPKKGEFTSLDDATRQLWAHGAMRAELLELLSLLDDQVNHLHAPLGLLRPVPLQVHATYTREEALAAFRASTVTAPLPLQTGVYWHEPTRTDLFFVTLEKTETHYSPTTRYRDYAISDRLFHWESQSTTTASSAMGQRYVNHEARGTNVVLFVRSRRTDVNGRTRPYFCAGRARYVEHRSERPMQITWELHDRLPGDVFSAFRAAVA